MKMLLSKNGISYSGTIAEIFPDAYTMRHNGDLVYAENGWQKVYQKDELTKLLPDKKLYGFIESGCELFIIYEDCIVSEFGKRYCMNVSKNVQIFKDLYQIRMINGSGVHFFGMFSTTYILDGIVLTFRLCPTPLDVQKYSVHTINRNGLYISYELDEESHQIFWTKNAKMTDLGNNTFRVRVKLVTHVYYIVNFGSGFASMTRKDVIGLHENGQNMIIEYQNEPHFELVPLGTDQRISVPEVGSRKNIKSARNL